MVSRIILRRFATTVKSNTEKQLVLFFQKQIQKKYEFSSIIQ